MPPELRFRAWHEPPPDYVFSLEEEECDLFSVEVVHNGFFSRSTEKLSYVSASTGFVDNCSAQAWSSDCVDQVLDEVKCERDGNLQVYWCMPGKDITDGLVALDRDAHYAAMSKASRVCKTLVLFVDHTDYL